MSRSRLSLGATLGATLGALLALAAGACDDVAPPEPGAAAPGAAAPAPSTARVAPPAGGIAPVANMPPGTACPPFSFLNAINYAVNPSFELGVPFRTWPPGPVPAPAAATGWFMHSSNGGVTPITTELVPTTAPGPAGLRMLAVRAGGNEGGVYQVLNTPARVMFSAWVRVTAGKVVIGTHAMVNQGPYAWSTKLGEWEQLRVCTDGANPPGWFFIYNQDPRGGAFAVDRVEIRAIP
jgi:hypothetical protein